MPAKPIDAGPGEPPPWLDVPFGADDEAHYNQPTRDVAVPSLPLKTTPARSEFRITDALSVDSEVAALTPFAPLAAAFDLIEPSLLGERWAALVQQMSGANLISAFARELAMQSQCLSLDERAPELMCRLRVERDSLRASAHSDKLRAALTELLQRPVHLEIELGVADDSPSKRDAIERARRQSHAEQIIHDDPFVRAMMAQYKTARVVPGSVKPH